MSPTITPAPTSSVISSTRGHALPKKILRFAENSAEKPHNKHFEGKRILSLVITL
jgi:hypothetical protein